MPWGMTKEDRLEQAIKEIDKTDAPEWAKEAAADAIRKMLPRELETYNGTDSAMCPGCYTVYPDGISGRHCPACGQRIA